MLRVASSPVLRRRLAGAGVLLAGLAVTGLAGLHQYAAVALVHDLHAHGVGATATIVHLDTVGSRSTRQLVDVAFDTDRGRVQARLIGDAQGGYFRSGKRRGPVGSRLPVVYDPQRPARVAAADQVSYGTGLANRMLALGVGLALLWVGLRTWQGWAATRRSRRRAQRRARPSAAELLPHAAVRRVFPSASAAIAVMRSRVDYRLYKPSTAPTSRWFDRLVVVHAMYGWPARWWTRHARRTGEPVTLVVPAYLTRDNRILLIPEPEYAVAVFLTPRRFAASHGSDLRQLAELIAARLHTQPWTHSD